MKQHKKFVIFGHFFAALGFIISKAFFGWNGVIFTGIFCCINFYCFSLFYSVFLQHHSAQYWKEIEDEVAERIKERLKRGAL